MDVNNIYDIKFKASSVYLTIIKREIFDNKRR